MKIDIFTKAMGCKKITYRNFTFLETVHRKNATALKKNRCNGDHLGNIRLSYSDANNNGSIEVASDPLTTEIIEENNYYPFGLKHKGYNNVVTSTNIAQKYKFGGAEYSEELGLNSYDFGARNYDPALGRWMNIDPLADLMRRHSPYNYAFNNPIFFIDPDGMAPMAPLDDIYLNRNGKEIFRVENKNPDRTFVIKTTKKTKQIYSNGSRDGNTNPISKSDANKTEKQIESGNLKGSHMNNVVQIENADTQQQMLDQVNQDDGKGGVISEANIKSMNSNNFKEFSGNIDKNGKIVDKTSGPVTLPLKETTKIEAGGDFDFHSHSSGQFTDTDGLTRSATQPTSDQDISTAKGTEYTFGMRSKKVYIYNNTGIIAIIPFKNFGKNK